MSISGLKGLYIDAYARIHTCTLIYIYIYGLIALLDNMQSSFSISTLNIPTIDSGQTCMYAV